MINIVQAFGLIPYFQNKIQLVLPYCLFGSNKFRMNLVELKIYEGNVLDVWTKIMQRWKNVHI